MTFEIFAKPTGRPRQTHCKWGHPFDAENTYESARPEGGKLMRSCRKCRTERQRKRRQRKRKS
jgi:hypothetical protein